jgi:MFS family permease
LKKRYSKDPQIDRSLRHSVRDGGAYAVMLGFGETYFSAFAVFLKASTAQIGFLASVPALLASFAQLLSAWLGHTFGNRKAIILLGAGLQAFIWIPMALLPWLQSDYTVKSSSPASLSITLLVISPRRNGRV